MRTAACKRRHGNSREFKVSIHRASHAHALHWLATHKARKKVYG